MTGQFLVVGVGTRRGTPAEEIGALVDAALAGEGLSPGAVRHLATVDARAAEPGIVAAAAARGWPVVAHPAVDLAAVAVKNPSAMASSRLRTPSVAEAAALFGGPAELVVPKRKSAAATVAVARHRDVCQTTVTDPGDPADQPGRHHGRHDDSLHEHNDERHREHRR